MPHWIALSVRHCAHVGVYLWDKFLQVGFLGERMCVVLISGVIAGPIVFRASPAIDAFTIRAGRSLFLCSVFDLWASLEWPVSSVYLVLLFSKCQLKDPVTARSILAPHWLIFLLHWLLKSLGYKGANRSLIGITLHRCSKTGQLGLICGCCPGEVRDFSSVCLGVSLFLMGSVAQAGLKTSL